MADAALKLDPSVLSTADQVRALAACVPSEQEAKLLAAYVRKDPSMSGLSDAERLCVDLMRVRGSMVWGLDLRPGGMGNCIDDEYWRVMEDDACSSSGGRRCIIFEARIHF